jgi:hypothetical protein
MGTNGTHRGQRCLPYILAVLICAVGSFVSAAFGAQDSQEVYQKPPKLVERQQVVRPEHKGLLDATPIRRNFKSWSLFLVCNPQWLSSEKAADLHDLYLSFRNFGNAIGDDNLAVWFSKAAGTSKLTSAGAEPDVEMSSRYFRQWSLKPSHGPYVVVTTTYPGNIPLLVLPGNLPADSAVFELGSMKSTEIHALLSRLTDQLLLGSNVRKNTQQKAAEQPTGLFVPLLEAVQNVIHDFGCAWSFNVDAGPLKANLQACHKG